MKHVLKIALIIVLMLVAAIAAGSYFGALTDDEKNGGGAQDEAQAAQRRDDDVFNSNLPIIDIRLESKALSKDAYTWCNVQVFWNEGANNYLDDEPQLTEAAAIKYRGSSSYKYFDKMQYKLEFRKKQGSENRITKKLLGMNTSDDWALYGPFLDTSLMRNKLLYTISQDIFEWAPGCRYCEVFVDGVYQGIYLVVEYPSNEPGRLNLSQFSLLSGETAYVVLRNDIGFGDVHIETYGETEGYTAYPILLKYPNGDDITRRQFEYIQRDLNRFERALYSQEYLSETIGYKTYIDVDSFVDYFIINEFSMLKDAGLQSVFLYKELGGKLKTTVWDFNNAFDLYMDYEKNPDEWTTLDSNWHQRFLQDDAFVDLVVARYRALRKTTLSDQNIMRIIDENADYIREAAQRNFEVYGYMFYESPVNSRKEKDEQPRSFEDAVQELKDIIIARGEFMDRNIEELYNYPYMEGEEIAEEE